MHKDKNSAIFLTAYLAEKDGTSFIELDLL